MYIPRFTILILLAPGLSSYWLLRFTFACWFRFLLIDSLPRTLHAFRPVVTPDLNFRVNGLDVHVQTWLPWTSSQNWDRTCGFGLTAGAASTSSSVLDQRRSNAWRIRTDHHGFYTQTHLFVDSLTVLTATVRTVPRSNADADMNEPALLFYAVVPSAVTSGLVIHTTSPSRDKFWQRAPRATVSLSTYNTCGYLPPTDSISTACSSSTLLPFHIGPLRTVALPLLHGCLPPRFFCMPGCALISCHCGFWLWTTTPYNGLHFPAAY